MELTNCEKCKKQISRSDLICPYCGHRNKETMEWWKNSQVYKIGGLVLIGAGVFILFSKLTVGISLLVVGIILFFVSKFLPQW